MKTYQIEVTEKLVRIIDVAADTLEEALSKVEDDYATGKIILDTDDSVFYDIKEYRR